MLLLDDDGALIYWVEKAPEGGVVRVWRIRADRKLDESLTVAPSGTARSSGFPPISRAGGELVFAWTGARALKAKLALPRK